MKNLEDFLLPTQKQLFKRLCKKFKGKTQISKGNFILVHGQAPVMLVAHLDTVHDEPVRDICVSADGNILMSPQGIGGDDRCGCFALVKVFQYAQIKPWLLFTCDEEIGGLGAKQFCLAHKQKQLPKNLDTLKLIIEIDRRGSSTNVLILTSRSISPTRVSKPRRGLSPTSLLSRRNWVSPPSIFPAVITTPTVFTSILFALNLNVQSKKFAKWLPTLPSLISLSSCTSKVLLNRITPKKFGTTTIWQLSTPSKIIFRKRFLQNTKTSTRLY